MRKMMMAMTALALSSGVAWGQAGAGSPAQQSVKLEAVVGSYCTIAGVSSPTSAGVVAVPLTDGIRAAGGALQNLPTIGTAFCTANAVITLTSSNGGLLNPGGAAAATPVGSNFANKIHYSATATYSDASVTMSTVGSSATTASVVSNESSLSAGGALSGATIGLTVTVAATSSTVVLAGGTYEDTLTVRLTPRT